MADIFPYGKTFNYYLFISFKAFAKNNKILKI